MYHELRKRGTSARRFGRSLLCLRHEACHNADRRTGWPARPTARLFCIGMNARLDGPSCPGAIGSDFGGSTKVVPSTGGAEAGEHYFLVCVLGDRGELCNVIPHKYVMSTDGKLVHGFDGLGVAEREEYCRIEELSSPSIEDFGTLHGTRRSRFFGQSASAIHRPAAAQGDPWSR